MKKLLNQFHHIKIFTFCLLTLGLVVSSQADDPDKMPTAEKVMMKFTEACGGADKFKAIKSMKMVGELNIPSFGLKGKLEVIQVMPNKVYTKAIIPGAGSETQVTNGDIAWALSTTSGARLVEGKEFEQLKEESNMDRFVDPMNFYKEVKVAGLEDVAGEKCYKVNITKKSGDKSTEYFSVKSGMQVKSETTLVTPMGDMKAESMIKKYKEVEGMKFPAETSISIQLGERVLTFDTIEINPEIDPKLFEVPDEIKELVEAKMKDEKGKDSDG